MATMQFLNEKLFFSMYPMLDCHFMKIIWYNLIEENCRSQNNGTAGRGDCCQAWYPKFNYRNLERENLLPHIVPWPPNTYIHISKINEEVLFKNVRQIFKNLSLNLRVLVNLSSLLSFSQIRNVCLSLWGKSQHIIAKTFLHFIIAYKN